MDVPVTGPARTLSDLRFVVVGAYVVDCFVRTPALPVWDAEYEVRSVRTSPGGKALNQAVALARLGVQVTAVGVVGADGFGRDILDLLMREGIDVSCMEQRPGVATAVCVVMVGDAGQTSILWHVDGDVSVTPATVRGAADAIREADAMLATFEMPAESVSAAIDLASDHGARVVVQPAPQLRDAGAARRLPWSRVNVVAPNRTEARALLAGAGAAGLPDDRLASAVAKQLGVDLVVVTLGADGCVIRGVDGYQRFPANEACPVDTTGASDAFAATFAANLIAGASEADAVRAAQVAAVQAIQRPGGYESMPQSDGRNVSVS